MTEIEIMQRAKLYLDKMANGIDPISDKAVSDNDCIKQIKVSRCLIYVSNILKKIIDDAEKTSQKEPIKIAKTVDLSISPQYVKVGCTVLLQDIITNKEKNLKYIPSYINTRYKTMGYKTKNYSEVTQTSDADGYSSISELSPLGKAILNKRVGDVVEFSVNDKIKRYKILSITE